VLTSQRSIANMIWPLENILFYNRVSQSLVIWPCFV